MIKCCPPYKGAKLSDISQGFIPKVHEANDWVAKYGTFLVAPFNAKVNVITGAGDKLNTSEFELERGCGIRLVSIEDPTLSVMFWHTQQFFPVKVGDTVLQGQVIAQMGNSGYVVEGGYVPLDERNKYPYKGTHSHITFGTEIENLDFSKYIDFSIPINYDAITTIKSILQNITNFLLNK